MAVSEIILVVRSEVFWSKGRKELAVIMTEIRPVTTGSWTLYGANSGFFDQGAVSAVPWEPACILTPYFLAFAHVGAGKLASRELGREGGRAHFNAASVKQEPLAEAKGRARRSRTAAGAVPPISGARRGQNSDPSTSEEAATPGRAFHAPLPSPRP